MKNRWVTLIFVVLLIIASTISTAVILADGGDAKPDGVAKLSTRVAEILGLHGPVVDSAIRQARKELRDKAIHNKLNALVEDGKFTQEEAEKHMREIQSWSPGIGSIGKRFFGKKGHHMHWKGYEKPSLGIIQQKLDREVRDGDMTREEADEILKRFEGKHAIGTWSP